jgi:hypothetical protein
MARLARLGNNTAFAVDLVFEEAREREKEC